MLKREGENAQATNVLTQIEPVSFQSQTRVARKPSASMFLLGPQAEDLPKVEYVPTAPKVEEKPAPNTLLDALEEKHQSDRNSADGI